MTSRDFAYWLQGYFEVADPDCIPAQATTMIKAHLALVFKHEIDPSAGSKEHQEELNAIHSQIPNYLQQEKKQDPAGTLYRC